MQRPLSRGELGRRPRLMQQPRPWGCGEHGGERRAGRGLLQPRLPRAAVSVSCARTVWGLRLRAPLQRALTLPCSVSGAFGLPSRQESVCWNLLSGP